MKISNLYGISIEDISYIKKIFSKHMKNQEFSLFVFGSRITENYSMKSDLDLLISSPGTIPYHKLAFIKEELEQSNLLFSVDLVNKEFASKSFLRLIDNSLLQIS